MPAPYPEEFRQRAVSLVRDEGRSVAQVARELRIAESGLRRWLAPLRRRQRRQAGPVQR